MKLPRLIIRALGAVFFAALALTSLTVTASYARAFESGLVFYPRALHYSGIPLGDTRTLAVVITNYSKDLVTISDITSTSSQFSVSRVILPRVLEPGRGFDLKVSFTPTAEGVADGQITVLSNAPDQTLSLGVSGTGTGGRVTASPERVWFGDVKLGATSTVSLLLTNPSAWKVTIHGVRVSGGAFSLSGPSFPLTLAPGRQIKLAATFKPQAEGVADGSLLIVGPGLNIPLSGKGTGESTPQLTVAPATLGFGKVGVGTTETLTLGLTAVGGSITVSSLSSSNSQFSVPEISFPLTIPEGHEVSLNVSFAPNSDGSQTANLSITSNASQSPLSEAMSGIGTPPYVTLSWNPSTSEVAGYNVYRSPSSSGSLTKINSSLDTETSYTDSTIATGKTYYYATTAVNSSGQESGYSNRVEVVIP